tara:strand:+ start:51 stop:242 length:192 start_codon:yes stop_codon:yes gene_type:complete
MFLRIVLVKAQCRLIKYIHQGPANKTGYQAYVYNTDGDVEVLKESVDKDVIVEYIAQYNKELE